MVPCCRLGSWLPPFIGALVAVPDLQSGGYRFESLLGLLRTKVYSAFHPSGVGK